MFTCAILTCKMRSTVANTKNGIIFHKFPADEELKEKWISTTGRFNWKPNKNSRICSRHFRDTDYFIQRSGQRYLKNGAIPCEHVVYQNLYPDEVRVPSPEEAVEVVEEVAPVQVEEASCPEEMDISIPADSTFEEEEDLDWEQFQAPVDMDSEFPAINTINIILRRKSHKKKVE